MRFDLRAILALAMVSAAVGCGPIPQPFRPPEWAKKHNEFLLAPLSAGVVVRGIEGPVGWVGDALTKAMAEALRERGIAAGSTWSNRLSLGLSGSGYQALHPDKRPELIMTWTLTEPGGAIRERREIRVTPPDAFWETPTAAMFRDVAERNAERIVSWIDPTRQERAPDIAGLPSLAILPIESAPGDGATSLARAVDLALKAERMRIVDSDAADLIVTPRIEVTPAPDRSEDVRLIWIVSTSDSVEIGRIDQENRIPQGQLDGRWGAVAVAIADGAAQGIADLARAYRDAPKSSRTQ
ncbi:MAG: hypothetical protein ISP41_04630 [Alphaproteobacteria bacterium]|jgi:hypothetical protein|nr:hypothetical protein [Alphaproteobacteria bacterium]